MTISEYEFFGVLTSTGETKTDTTESKEAEHESKS